MWGRLPGKQGLAVNAFSGAGGGGVIHKQLKSRALVLLRCFPRTTHRRVCIEGKGEEVMLQGLVRNQGLEEQAE